MFTRKQFYYQLQWTQGLQLLFIPSVVSVLIQIGLEMLPSQDLPDDQDQSALLTLGLKTVTSLIVSETITIIKLGPGLRFTCRAMAENDLRDKRDQGLPINALTNKNRDDLWRSAGSFIFYLFSSVQNQKTLTSDLVKGLGSFELDPLLHAPLPHAVYCFTQLFTSSDSLAIH